MINIFQCIRNNSKGTQPQEVHLQQAEPLHQILVILSDKRTVRQLYRQIVGKGASGDNNTSRMGG